MQGESNNGQESENISGKDSGLRKFFNTKWSRIVLGLAIGAVAGTLYWNYIGCTGGTCPLTSNPYNTVILFSLMGGWISYK